MRLGFTAALQYSKLLLFWQTLGLCDFSWRTKTSHSFGLREAPWSAAARRRLCRCLYPSRLNPDPIKIDLHSKAASSRRLCHCLHPSRLNPDPIKIDLHSKAASSRRTPRRFAHSACMRCLFPWRVSTTSDDRFGCGPAALLYPATESLPKKQLDGHAFHLALPPVR